MKKEMLINVLQPEECRIAILENNVLEELYVERTSHESYVGNIYKGRIVNIEPSIQAAFVDFGVGRNGFLHVSDVEPAYYRHLEQRRGDRDRNGNGGRRERGRRGNGRRERGRRREDDELERAVPAAEDVAAGPLDDDSTVPAEGIPLLPGEEQASPNVEVEAPEEVSTSEVVVEAEAAAEPEPARGRRRTPRGRARKPRSEEAAPAAESKEPAPPEPAAEVRFVEAEEPEAPTRKESERIDRPRLMDSADRRTDEDEPGTPSLGSQDFTDDDLSFSSAPQSRPAAGQAASLPQAGSLAGAPPEEPSVGAPSSVGGWSPDHAPTGEDQAPTEFEPEYDEEEEQPAPTFDEQEEDEDELLPPRPERYEHDTDLADDLSDEEADERLAAFDEDEELPGPRPSRGRRDDRRNDRRGGRGGPRGGPRRMGGRPGAGRPKPLIQDIFKRGQEVLVQVIKEGLGTKGPTLSTYISIAGRYLVLMPGLNRIGVSRKIVDEEQRRRLREILTELEPPKGLGFIIRTAGLDRTKKELQRDLAYLSRLWQVVVRRIRKLKAPAEIYQESDMITRTIRDTFAGDIETILVDEPAAFEQAQEFMQIVMPRYASRIKLYTDPVPMFHKYGIEEEIVRIQQRHVPLPNGGSIVIDQTEALVAIDVNSGNFRAGREDAEETAFQMNLLAAKEIARQLRLRDLGGVIVNDFIDMRDEKHRRGVEKAMRDAVKRDRARTKLLKISQFGIIEMTRQRIRPSLKRSIYQDCPHCRSTGQVKTVESMSIDVMRLLQLAAHRENVQRVQIRVQEDVANYLHNRKRREITKLEESGDIQVAIMGVPGVSPEFLEFLSYDSNNNETRFQPYEETRPRRR
ncbi:MAG: Rne/Rng family ribonuclease [Gemmataceae bacterium]|nr:Rne/Rng family ribonuclease [Gemmataceae bacterium]